MADEQIVATAENQEALPTNMVTDEDATNGVVRTTVQQASAVVVLPQRRRFSGAGCPRRL